MKINCLDISLHHDRITSKELMNIFSDIYFTMGKTHFELNLASHECHPLLKAAFKPILKQIFASCYSQEFGSRSIKYIWGICANRRKVTATNIQMQREPANIHWFSTGKEERETTGWSEYKGCVVPVEKPATSCVCPNISLGPGDLASIVYGFSMVKNLLRVWCKQTNYWQILDKSKV